MAIQFIDAITTSEISIDGQPLAKLLLSQKRAQIAGGKLGALLGQKAKRIVSEKRKQEIAALRSRLFRFAAKDTYQEAIENAFARQIGGKLLKATSGIGAVPDFVLPDGTTGDVKLKATIGKGVTREQALDQLLAKKSGNIEITGGRGIRLTEGQKLFTGVTSQAEGEAQIKTEAIKAGVVDRLIQAKLTKKGTALQSEIISILKDSGALFQNLFTKASFLSVSLTLVYAGKKETVNFIFKLSRQALLDPKVMAYKIEIDEGKNGVRFFADVRADVMRRLVEAHRSSIIKATEKTMESKNYTDAVSVLALLDPTDTSNQINSSTLNNSGSPEARTVVGLITQNKQGSATQDPQQRFVSGVQLSALVQRRLSQIMPRGPERGPPLSPNVLTERSGRFRSSVQVFPNYRMGMIRYAYDPIYKTFINTPRNPDDFVGRTIREITQQLFGRQFNLVRV